MLYEKPIISVITVCLNAEKTIEKTLRSVASQRSEKNVIEHIVVDGASSDNTLKIINSQSNIKFVSEKDKGIYDAMNKGASMASGQYLCFLNADDWFEPNALTTVIRTIQKKPNIDLFHGNMKFHKDCDKTEIKKSKFLLWTKYLRMPVYHPTCFVNSRVFCSLEGFDESFSTIADYDFILRLLEERYKTYHIDKVLTNFSSGGVSGSASTTERIDLRVKHGIPYFLSKLIVMLIDLRRIFN